MSEQNLYEPPHEIPVVRKVSIFAFALPVGIAAVVGVASGIASKYWGWIWGAFMIPLITYPIMQLYSGSND